MKLSQKLLALGGVTLADYACCPYDDYGMPHSLCTTALPEKTPFSMQSDWRDGACKAWEANVDATFDGNDNNCETNENWGSCGFQRHFPWNQIDTTELRNRGCVLSNDDGTVTAESGQCTCKGLGDAVDTSSSGTGDNQDAGGAAANVIRCKSTKLVAGTSNIDGDNSVQEDCTTNYLEGTHGTMELADLILNKVCCDPTKDHGAYNTAPVTPVSISCFRQCTAAESTFMDTKDNCITDDFLGRRNIQSQNLYIKDDTYYHTTDHSPPLSPTVFELGFSYNAAADGSTAEVYNSKLYNLAGVPFLGGVCKLFVPVPKSKITSVQIAGVHVSLDNTSVWAAKVGESNAYTQGTTQVGTAYCFSVVNPAEGMKNSNNIMNGNVAGNSFGAGGADSVFDQLAMTDAMTSLTRQAGLEPKINFFDGTDEDHIGTQLMDDSGEADGDSEVGANFDVVVHIHSEWCNSESFWNYADMQLTGDYNNGNMDYPLNLAPADAPSTDQRTGAAYSASQTEYRSQLAYLRQVADDKQGLEDTASTTYTNGALNTFTTGTCGVALAAGGQEDCLEDVNDYLEAYINEQECEVATPGECSALAAITAAAKLLLMEDNVDDNIDLVTTGCLVALDTACTVSGLGITQLDDLLTGADTYAAAKGATLAAENDVNAALQSNNGFTHAHMDLMDKRNNFVADWNNVYEQDPDNSGYLRFPHSDDDQFRAADGTKGTYTTTAENQYLRWPNAGAFAAFYSFVACANPPHISNTLTNAADVNAASIIYNSGLAPQAPSSAETAYSDLGDRILTERTLVMSQSDSDYRDEKCENRQFRANLRQVGNKVTVCGPGQLPDTDGKRCTWNWNYNAHAYTGQESTGPHTWDAPSPQGYNDAEEWFDRNDPHSFDMWSTRRRRSAAFANGRKYAFNSGYWGAQQGDDGTGADGLQTKMWQGQVAFNAENPEHAAAIQIPISNYDFRLSFKTANDEKPPLPAVTFTADDCFEPGKTCLCRPSHLLLTGFEDASGVAIAFAEDYYDSDLNAIFDGVADNVAHSSCSGTANTNGVATCDSTERGQIKANLQIPQECFGFKANGTGGFFQTANQQSLDFDDDRIKVALNPTLDTDGDTNADFEWEVSVQCDQRTDMATLASHISQRDYFPDCFFGDELWFTFTYGSGSSHGNEAQFTHNSYVSAWYSDVTTGTTPEYILN